MNLSQKLEKAKNDLFANANVDQFIDDMKRLCGESTGIFGSYSNAAIRVLSKGFAKEAKEKGVIDNRQFEHACKSASLIFQ